MAARLGRHRDDVAGLERVERLAALAAHRHGRGPSRQRAGGAVVESDLPDVARAIDQHAGAPILIVDADIGVEERLEPVPADIGMPDRPRPAAAAIVAQQTVLERLLRILLKLGIQRGAHPQAARIDAIGPALVGLAELVDQLAAHFLDEIAADAFELRRLARHGAERRRDRGVVLGLVDEAVGEHLSEHPVAAIERALGVAFGIIVGRPLGQDRQIGHLRQAELVELLAEIGLACRLDAAGVAPQLDRVEVQLHDLLLGERVLHAPGEDAFLGLAQIAGLVADQQVLGDLLRDRGGAARCRAADQALKGRAHQAGKVDAVMLEEGLVLGGHVRLDQELGIFGEAQLHAAFARIAVDRQPLDRADIGGERRLVILERVDRGQVARDEQPDEEHEQAAEQGQYREDPEPPAVAHAIEQPLEAPDLALDAHLYAGSGGTVGHAGRGLAGLDAEGSGSLARTAPRPPPARRRRGRRDGPGPIRGLFPKWNHSRHIPL